MSNYHKRAIEILSTTKDAMNLLFRIAQNNPASIVHAVDGNGVQYSVVMVDRGKETELVRVIKAIREITNDIGMKEAKDMYDSTMPVVFTGSESRAAEAAKLLIEAGAIVDVQKQRK